MSRSSAVFKLIPESERNADCTVYVGNLDDSVDEELLYELMIQAGPVANIYIPKDRINGESQGYAFCEFKTERDADYASLILNDVRLYGKPIRVNKAASEKSKEIDIGAHLFVGNLDPMVDSNLLQSTFSAFGNLASAPRIVRDEEGQSKGYAFVSFDSFEASDKAIEGMNNQFLMNKPVTVSYAFKQNGKGERHGDEAERLLAAQARSNNYTLKMNSQNESRSSSNQRQWQSNFKPPPLPKFVQ